MEIKLGSYALWGGMYPDIAKNKRITLNFGGVEFTFEGYEYEKLISLLDETGKKLYKDSEKIVAKQILQNGIMAELDKDIDEYTDKHVEYDYELCEIVQNHLHKFWSV